MKKLFLTLGVFAISISSQAAYLLIPMDASQTNHLRAYGVAWNVLNHETDVKWLLNYRGGSYLFEYNKEDEQSCLEKNVLFETLPDVQARSILKEVKNGKNNTAVVEMQRAPKIAVYAPSRQEAWDDAVISVLNYAAIPFDVIYDSEVLQGDLSKYDWLHLHHEDFTGQQGRCHLFATRQWYLEAVADDESNAKKNGFAKVSQMKLAVALKMKTYVSNGGFLFAMCSATETFDIALAAEGTDIVPSQYDGDAHDPDYAAKLNFSNGLAFENYRLNVDANNYKMSNLDTYLTRIGRGVKETNDYFSLATFDVQTQQEQALLVQNHSTTIKGFWGATTGFDLSYIKKDVDILAANTLEGAREARYLHGNLGEGMWTYYGGHDPEDYQHRFEEPVPDIALFPNSPGYRLILNNVLFQSTRSTEEIHQSFSAYPSPATTAFTVNYTLGDNADGVLNIYDASGKLAYAQTLQPGTSTTTIDVSGLTAGNYLWRIESNNKSLHTDRFSVSH